MPVNLEEIRPVPFTDAIHDYYCRRREGGADNEGGGTIYEIWERGEAFRDSVTPSTYCGRYRAHLVDKLTIYAPAGTSIFSIGCGNAFVEGDMALRSRQVEAIDCNEDAARLALDKRVKAYAADYLALPPGHLRGFAAIYADGLLGHLYREPLGLDPFFEQLDRLEPDPGSALILSNDAPLSSGEPAQPHPVLKDFWLISRELLESALARFGHDILESYHFPYERPISGWRNRTICIARVKGR
jgi:hypothetical protein